MARFGPVRFGEVRCGEVRYGTYKGVQKEVAVITVIPIMPMIWGMGFLAFGFIIYPFVGLMWFLIIMGVGALATIYIGIRMIKTAEKKDKSGEGK